VRTQQQKPRSEAGTVRSNTFSNRPFRYGEESWVLDDGVCQREGSHYLPRLQQIASVQDSAAEEVTGSSRAFPRRSSRDIAETPDFAGEPGGI
jgi:hypothetical protein